MPILCHTGEHRFAKCFAGDGPCIQTDSTHDPTLFYHGHPFPQFGGLDSGSLTSGAAADAQEIEVERFNTHACCRVPLESSRPVMMSMIPHINSSVGNGTGARFLQRATARDPSL